MSGPPPVEPTTGMISSNIDLNSGLGEHPGPERPLQGLGVELLELVGLWIHEAGEWIFLHQEIAELGTALGIDLCIGLALVVRRFHLGVPAVCMLAQRIEPKTMRGHPAFPDHLLKSTEFLPGLSRAILGLLEESERAVRVPAMLRGIARSMPETGLEDRKVAGECVVSQGADRLSFKKDSVDLWIADTGDSGVLECRGCLAELPESGGLGGVVLDPWGPGTRFSNLGSKGLGHRLGEAVAPGHENRATGIRRDAKAKNPLKIAKNGFGVEAMMHAVHQLLVDVKTTERDLGFAHIGAAMGIKHRLGIIGLAGGRPRIGPADHGSGELLQHAAGVDVVGNHPDDVGDDLICVVLVRVRESGRELGDSG